MARSRTVDAPATTDVYFGMVFCTFLAVLTAVGLLAWELTSYYNWESTPPALAAPNLPKVPERVKPTGTAMMPVEEKPLAKLAPAETPAPKTTATPASSIKEPAPIPAAVTAVPALKPTPTTPATAVPTEKPAEQTPASTGPRPGFQIPRR